MFDDPQRNRQTAKWIICVVSICALITLGLRHIGSITEALLQITNLFKPILIGVIVALILNVPMGMIEQRFLQKLKIKRRKRGLSIVLSLILILGVFVGIAFLVIPELIKAVSLLIQIISDGLE